MKNHPIAGSLAFVVLVGGLGYGILTATRSSMHAASEPSTMSDLKPSNGEDSEPLSLGEAISRGIQLARQDRTDEALGHFEQLTRSHPDVAATWYNYGLALSAVRLYDASRTALERALALDPDFWDSTAELATLHVLEKDISGALELMETIPPGEGRVGKRLRLDPVWQEVEDPRIGKLLAKHPSIEDTSLRGTKAMDRTRPALGSDP
ncbi:MAG: tetratricopeptide repeat protein [Myxococcota bacterium]